MFAVFYEDSITSEFNIFLKKKPLKAVDELLVSVYIYKINYITLFEKSHILTGCLRKR